MAEILSGLVMALLSTWTEVQEVVGLVLLMMLPS